MQVGADIGSMCRKCGDTWHVIVALAAGRTPVVECKQCGGRHRYKSPDGAPRPRAEGAAAKSPRKAGRKKAAPADFDASRPIRAYQVTERFDVGDRVDHPKFGTGVVAARVGATKIQVEFPDAIRVLIDGR